MARKPVRRRPSTKRRTQARNDGILLFGLIVAAGIVLLLTLIWLFHHLLLLLGLLTAALVTAVLVVRGKAAAARREHEAQTAQLRHIGAFLTMNPKDFEHALATLCRRDGCTKVTVVGGAGDLAADVLATTPTGQRILIQAKRYGPKTLVGSQDVQKVNGTYRDVHRCDLALVVTTSSFTKAAAAFCTQVGIRAIDQRALALWAEGTAAPPWN
ncbi:restriction endonuclease [Kitasatospora cineracea]|uniref:restriction endonuclease n=1 Tax=Kitasatospora cineracea TaxID=88074 RepID=UPI00341FE2E6